MKRFLIIRNRKDDSINPLREIPLEKLPRIIKNKAEEAVNQSFVVVYANETNLSLVSVGIGCSQ